MCGYENMPENVMHWNLGVEFIFICYNRLSIITQAKTLSCLLYCIVSQNQNNKANRKGMKIGSYRR